MILILGMNQKTTLSIHYTGVLRALEALERILQCLFGSFSIQCAFSELQKVTTREGREGEESASLNKYKTHCLVINRSSGQSTWWQEAGRSSIHPWETVQYSSISSAGPRPTTLNRIHSRLNPGATAIKEGRLHDHTCWYGSVWFIVARPRKNMKKFLCNVTTLLQKMYAEY